MSAFCSYFSPFHFAFVCLFCLSYGTAFSSTGSSIYSSRATHCSSPFSCPSFLCLYLVLILDHIISPLPVSVGLFWGEFFLFFQDYFWLCQRLPQWQASVCLSLMSCPLRALCDYFLHVDRYRLKCGPTTYRTCVCLYECDHFEDILQNHI